MPELADSKFPQVHTTIAASTYIDPSRFEVEKSAVFRKVPVVAGPSAALPAPRSYFQQDIAGMPALITRNKEGTAKAFANVCRHRGARLCSAAGKVDGSLITCPYHAWSYSLDGKLMGIPRQETFAGIDKKELGLLELPCLETFEPRRRAVTFSARSSATTSRMYARSWCLRTSCFPTVSSWSVPNL
jgi:phenylpropionate dioxygenase-like ring-hydroxylating dioxygenase large terminal subunit